MKRRLDEICLECWELQNEPSGAECYDEAMRSLEEKYARWMVIWRSHVASRDIGSLSLERVECVLSLGSYLASMTDQHSAAVEYLRALQSHPEFRRLDPVLIIHHGSGLIWSLLHLGDERGVVDAATALLELNRRCDRTMARNSIRDWLTVYISNLEAEAQRQRVASADLTDLVWRIALLYKRRPVVRTRPNQATYEQLLNVLWLTHPPKER